MFQIGEAYKAIKRARQPDNPNNFEKFNNDDYNRLEQVDFRSVRYKKKAVYGEDSMEQISELEGDEDIDQSQLDNDDAHNQSSSAHDDDDSIIKIANKKQKVEKINSSKDGVNKLHTQQLDQQAIAKSRNSKNTTSAKVDSANLNIKNESQIQSINQVHKLADDSLRVGGNTLL